MPQTKRSKIDGKRYPWPHNAMIQPMKPVAAPLWTRAPRRPAAAFWGDADGDGVINAFDCAPKNPRRQGPQHKKCSRCNASIDPLEVFPGGLCVNCYEKQFDERVKKTGVLPKPDFTKVFNEDED